jgi:hypothetical protein
MSALSGRILAIATAVVPTDSFPFWGEKSWTHELFSFPGIKTGDVSLFNFTKTSRQSGVSLEGAVTQDDVGDLEAEKALAEYCKRILDDISSPENRNSLKRGADSIGVIDEVDKEIVKAISSLTH